MNRIIRSALLAGAAVAVLALPACGAYGAGGTYTEPASGQQGAAQQGNAAGKGNSGAGAAAPVPRQRAGAPASNNGLTARAIAKMGQVVVDKKGHVLYLFTKDAPGTSNCYGDCAAVWPPVLTADTPALRGIDPSLVGSTTRKDGTRQVTLGKKRWPLYWYIGDKKPGQWKGQNVGSVWFVIGPNGKPNLTCLPAPSKAVSPPTSSSDSGTDSGGGSDY